MHNLTTPLARLLKNEDGATAIEYSLIAALVGVGLVAALTGLKTEIAGLFTTIGTSLK